MKNLLYERPVKSFMRTLRKPNDIRVSAKYLDALCCHLSIVLQDMCCVEGNEKRITKFHVKTRKNAPSGLVRESAVRRAVVSAKGGPTQISKGVFAQINAYVAAVCRASVDAAGDRMTVTNLAFASNVKRLPVLDRRVKCTAKRSTGLQEKGGLTDYRERRRLTVKYTVTLQGTTLQGTMPMTTAYKSDKLKESVTNNVRRFFDHLGLHGSVEVNVYAIEVRE